MRFLHCFPLFSLLLRSWSVVVWYEGGGWWRERKGEGEWAREKGRAKNQKLQGKDGETWNHRWFSDNHFPLSFLSTPLINLEVNPFLVRKNSYFFPSNPDLIKKMNRRIVHPAGPYLKIQPVSRLPSLNHTNSHTEMQRFSFSHTRVQLLKSTFLPERRSHGNIF